MKKKIMKLKLAKETLGIVYGETREPWIGEPTAPPSTPCPGGGAASYAGYSMCYACWTTVGASCDFPCSGQSCSPTVCFAC